MTKSRRILILTADAGFGHRSAANAIEAALKQSHGDACAVQVVNALDHRRVPSFLRDSQSDYDRILKEMPELYRLGYRTSDATVPAAIFERALTVLLLPALRDIVVQHRPHAIVTTYPLYQAPLAAMNALARRAFPLLTVVTDPATVHRIWFNTSVDLCLVPTETVQLLAVEAGVPKERVEVVGIPVSPLIAADARPRAQVRRELGWREDLTTVLAVGSRRVGGLPDALRALNHSGLPIQLAVAAGGDDETFRELQSVQWHVEAHVYNFVKNMPDLMRAADCIICKAGGLIVTESLARGLPLVLIDVIPGQETGNAEYVVQGGAGALAQAPVDVLETLYDWLADGGRLLAERAENAGRLGRPRAALDIAERAWQAAQRGPAERAGSFAEERARLKDLLKSFDVRLG